VKMSGGRDSLSASHRCVFFLARGAGFRTTRGDGGPSAPANWAGATGAARHPAARTMRPPFRHTSILILALAPALLSASCGRAGPRHAAAKAPEAGAAAHAPEAGAAAHAHASGDTATDHAAAGDSAALAGGVAAGAADEDGDGLPDRAELRSSADRESFRRWFTGLAEAQFYEPSREWNPGQRDCAGLVRFALREALRRHDRAWYLRMGPGYEQLAPDVRAYTLERSPVGEKLFRTRAGSFAETDLSDGTLSEFADARTLKDYNAQFAGRDPAAALPGDLLFFHRPRAAAYPYHVMVYLGRARADGGGAADWVVYHTGSSPDSSGEVRKVRLSTLARHPDQGWRPVAANRNFLGFYRLRILQ